MKQSIMILMVAALGLSFWNSNTVTQKLPMAPTAKFPSISQGGTTGYAGLRYKRVAAGEDVNKNRFLDENEKMKKLEPGAYDNIHFIDDRKIHIYGMGMDLYGVYKIKWEGPKMFFVITADTTLRVPPSESAHKFEIVAGMQDSMLMIPPIFSFMLCIYEKQK